MKTPPSPALVKKLLRISAGIFFVGLVVDTNFHAVIYVLLCTQLIIIYVIIDLVVDRLFEK